MRRTYGSTRRRCSSSSYATGDNRPRGAQKSEEVQLATDRPQTNDRRKIHMRLVDVIPGTETMQIKEEVIPAVRAEWEIRSLYQGAMMRRKRGIQGTLHQWP